MNHCFGIEENQVKHWFNLCFESLNFILNLLQVFVYNKRSQISSDDKCLDPSNIIEPVSLITCNNLESQSWIYDSKVN